MRAQFSYPMPRHRKMAMSSVLLYSISKVIPKKSRRILRHQIVKGETRPSLTELVFFSLSARRVNKNHWQLVEMTPEYLISSMNLPSVFLTNYSTFSPSQAASKVIIEPVVVSALRLRLQPDERDALSPLQKSVQIQMSGRQSRNAVLTWSLMSLRMLVEILLPAQMPLILLVYPLSSMLTLFNFLTVGIVTCTSPPPSGRQPLLMILTESSLSNSQWSLSKGMRCCWIESTELSWLSLVTPVRLTAREFLPNIEISKRYSRQQPMLRWSPQSKVNQTPSLLVIMPAQNRIWVPPLATIILDPLETDSTSFRKVDSSGLRPGGFLRMLMSSKTMFCSAMIAHRMVCRKLLGSLRVSIDCCNYSIPSPYNYIRC